MSHALAALRASQIQSPCCSFSGKYTSERYWNPYDDNAWISALVFVCYDRAAVIRRKLQAMDENSEMFNKVRGCPPHPSPPLHPSNVFVASVSVLQLLLRTASRLALI